jgi:hypothetical protein
VTKFKPYPRREFRRRFAGWAGRNAWLITGLTAGLTVLLVVETLLLVGVGTPGPMSWWLLGAMQAGMIAIYLHVLHNAFLANDREPSGTYASPGAKTTPVANSRSPNADV